MELILLGTAAAEGWPAAFCSCRACEGARSLGGRNIRHRTSALLDDVVQIDFGPDTVSQMMALGRKLTPITSLIFTHHHEDHLCPLELGNRATPYVPETQLPLLQVFGNETALEMLDGAFPDELVNAQKYRMRFERPLQPFEQRESGDGTTILPLPADHAPKALVLRIEREGRRIFYGHDSGQYPDETVEALCGVALDVALFDTTYGIKPSENRGHMGIDGVLAAIDRLRAVGAVTGKTQLIATHYSHNGLALYDELCERLDPHGVAVAYDGMVVEV